MGDEVSVAVALELTQRVCLQRAGQQRERIGSIAAKGVGPLDPAPHRGVVELCWDALAPKGPGQLHAVLSELLHAQPVHQDSTALHRLDLVGRRRERMGSVGSLC